MADQATMSRNGRPMAPEKTLGRNVAGFAHDVLTLAELQAKLLIVDVNQFLRRVAVPGAVMISAAVVALAALPLLLMAAAWGLIALFHIHQALSYLLVSVAAILIAGVAMRAAWRTLRARFHILQQSLGELQENLTAIKLALKQQEYS